MQAAGRSQRPPGGTAPVAPPTTSEASVEGEDWLHHDAEDVRREFGDAKILQAADLDAQFSRTNALKGLKLVGGGAGSTRHLAQAGSTRSLQVKGKDNGREASQQPPPQQQQQPSTQHPKHGRSGASSRASTQSRTHSHSGSGANDIVESGSGSSDDEDDDSDGDGDGVVDFLEEPEGGAHADGGPDRPQLGAVTAVTGVDDPGSPVPGRGDAASSASGSVAPPPSLASTSSATAAAAAAAAVARGGTVFKSRTLGSSSSVVTGGGPTGSVPDGLSLSPSEVVPVSTNELFEDGMYLEFDKEWEHLKTLKLVFHKCVRAFVLVLFAFARLSVARSRLLWVALRDAAPTAQDLA
jgi:hypothetical protein